MNFTLYLVAPLYNFINASKNLLNLVLISFHVCFKCVSSVLKQFLSMPPVQHTIHFQTRPPQRLHVEKQRFEPFVCLRQREVPKTTIAVKPFPKVTPALSHVYVCLCFVLPFI